MSFEEILKLAAKFEEKLISTAAPKQVLDKKLWNEIEKKVMKYKSNYKEPYAVVMKAYLDAGGKLSHESDKK